MSIIIGMLMLKQVRYDGLIVDPVIGRRPS